MVAPGGLDGPGDSAGRQQVDSTPTPCHPEEAESFATRRTPNEGPVYCGTIAAGRQRQIHGAELALSTTGVIFPASKIAQKN